MLNPLMTNHFLMYWREDQIANQLQKDELNYAGSNQFNRLSIGDVVWIAGRTKKASLVTVGPLLVAEIIGQKEAEKRLPLKPWEATHHVINMENPFKPKDIDLTPILNQLEFDSGSGTKLNLETPIGQQLQPMRRLTDQSVRLIQSLWNSAAQSDPIEFDRIQNDLDKYDELNRKIEGLARREQSFLRRHLFQDRETGHCVICGDDLPVPLLVAAHIKPRAVCTDEERRDYINNVAPMCLLGCDALFERGIIIVEDGKVRVRIDYDESDGLGKLLKRLDGKAILSWEPERQKYFRWKADQTSAA
jgi:hypothetical protein